MFSNHPSELAAWGRTSEPLDKVRRSVGCVDSSAFANHVKRILFAAARIELVPGPVVKDFTKLGLVAREFGD